MENDTLTKIQKLGKLGLILSKVVFWASIAGIVGCAIAIIVFAIGGATNVVIDGKTIIEYLEQEAGMSSASLYATAAFAIVSCAGEIYIAKKAIKYFESELVDGTPFTFDGADQLKFIGIASVIISCVTTVIGGIIYAIADILGNAHIGYDIQAVSITTGIAFVVFSLICRYGAEIIAQKEDK